MDGDEWSCPVKFKPLFLLLLFLHTGVLQMDLLLEIGV